MKSDQLREDFAALCDRIACAALGVCTAVFVASLLFNQVRPVWVDETGEHLPCHADEQIDNFKRTLDRQLVLQATYIAQLAAWNTAAEKMIKTTEAETERLEQSAESRRREQSAIDAVTKEIQERDERMAVARERYRRHVCAEFFNYNLRSFDEHDDDVIEHCGKYRASWEADTACFRKRARETSYLVDLYYHRSLNATRAGECVIDDNLMIVIPRCSRSILKV